MVQHDNYRVLLAHDRAGNMTTMPWPGDPTVALRCVYDAWNRLAAAEVAEVSEFWYRYDGLNRRTVERFYAGGEDDPHVYRFYNSSWQTFEMLVTVGAVEPEDPENVMLRSQWVWSQRYIDAAVLRDDDTDVDGQCDDQRLYLLNDANFNVTCLVDTSGDALERYGYEPYGQPLYYAGDWSGRSYSSYDNQVLYTGREYDPDTGLYNYRNRPYHPLLGRFTGRDPIGYEARSVNVYAYVGSRLVGARDPYGLTSSIGAPEVP
jgi:RHS repeat-associated protein